MGLQQSEFSWSQWYPQQTASGLKVTAKEREIILSPISACLAIACVILEKKQLQIRISPETRVLDYVQRPSPLKSQDNLCPRVRVTQQDRSLA